MNTTLLKVSEFFFAPVNRRPVRIFSIILGCLAIVNFNYWDPQGIGHFSSTYAYRGILALVTVAFIAGVRPRITGLILVAMLMPLSFEGYRTQSRQVLLFSLLCLSLLDGGKSSRDLPMWPIRLIQMQLCVVYGINALAKCNPDYLSGDVLVAMSMTLPHVLIDMSDGIYRLGPLVIPAGMAAKASVAVEAFLSVGFWIPPLLWITAIVGIVFHCQLMTVIQIAMLDWVSMVLYLSFLLRFSNKAQT